MANTKLMVVSGGAVLVVSGAVGLALYRHRETALPPRDPVVAVEPVEPDDAPSDEPAAVPPLAHAEAAEPAVPDMPQLMAQPQPPPADDRMVQLKKAWDAAARGAVGDKPIPLPEARNALALVGADREAEIVWMHAINDPNTPAKYRTDLIEDLNDHGYPDNKNITLSDLPLIEARISLIELIGENAIDEVNAAAFKEAYKDLTKMRFRLTGR